MIENWQPSDLSWSYSKKQHYDDCPRHYFYHRFWGQDPRVRWLLYEMRNITTITMLGGSVTHQVIVEALNGARHGREMTSDWAKERITELLREKYIESAKQLWRIDRRPPGRKAASICNLLEHYYKMPDPDSRIRHAREVAWKSLTNLLESELWPQITGEPAKWQTIDSDDFPHFDMNGIKIYATIDFAHTIDGNTIIDWKSGQPTEQSMRQLTLYSLYAQSAWGWDPLETKLKVAYLQPQLQIDERFPTPSDIESVKQEALASFNQLADLEPPYGKADPETFPMGNDPTHCVWCRFQGHCPGGKQVSR